MQKLRSLCLETIESLATAKSILLTRRRDVWRHKRYPRHTRGISTLSPRLGITPVIFKIRHDTPWWKLLENFARRMGTWNSVVLIPSDFRAPSGPGAFVSRLARTLTDVTNTALACTFTRSARCEGRTISRACGWTRLFANPLAGLARSFPFGQPDGRRGERKTAECSDSYSELLKRLVCD